MLKKIGLGLHAANFILENYAGMAIDWVLLLDGCSEHNALVLVSKKVSFEKYKFKATVEVK